MKLIVKDDKKEKHESFEAYFEYHDGYMTVELCNFRGYGRDANEALQRYAENLVVLKSRIDQALKDIDNKEYEEL